MTATEKIEKLIDLITLAAIPSVGPNRLYNLINHFGSAAEVLSASKDDISEIPGLGRTLAELIYQNLNRSEAESIVEDIIKREWNFVLYNDPEYPEPLKNIQDKPPYLFYAGSLVPADANAVAIVGSRDGTENGRLFAKQLGEALAQRKVTVISGMARGVDTAAHRGALDASGRTIAVFGSSLDTIYPPENKDLAFRIRESGAIISEFLPGTIPGAHNFPRRNRIISGLAQGVVVVEAAERSGALSTASHALAQNREVFAVPGPPRTKYSKGTNRLIKDGAELLMSVNDIFEQLPRLIHNARAAQVRKTENLTNTEKSILNHFGDGPVHIDVLSRELNTPVSELLQILLALELRGIIQELSGKRFILN